MSTPSPRTLLGPLTTTWTAPPICSYAMALCDTCTTVWQGQTCNPVSNAHDFTDCWPPRSGGQASIDPGVMMGWGLYSPGVACPAGYTTAAMATAGGVSGWGVEYSMLSGETAVACCPSGFSISWISATNTLAQTCVTTATSTSFVTVQCNSGTFVEFSSVTVPNTVSADNKVLSSYVLFAPLYQLNFQASDVPAKTTSSPTTSSSSSSSPTSTPLTLPTSGIPAPTTSETSPSSSSASTSMAGAPTGSGTAPPPPTIRSGGGLSSGAKAGIGVGVALGAVLLIALAILIFRLRKNRKLGSGSSDPDAPPLPPTGLAGTASEKGGGRNASSGRRPQGGVELGSEEVRELDGRPVVTELPTRLPSDRIPPDRKVFRRSDQGWVVPSGADGGRGSGSPVVEPHGGAVFELEGDTTPTTSGLGSRRL